MNNSSTQIGLRPVRTVLELVFQNITPLRIGAGDDGGLFRCHGGTPYIPSTTLKGACRATLVRAGLLAECEEMFGIVKDTQADLGKPGKVIFSGAVAESNSVAKTNRTAIDDASGTAAHNKLFEQEVAASGTTWKLRITITGNLLNEAQLALYRLLNTLKKQGIRLGRNKGDGDGLTLLKAINESDAQRQGSYVLEIDGKKPRIRKLMSGDIEKLWSEIDKAPDLGAGNKTWDFTLKCDGPFAILGEEGVPETGGRKNVLKTLGYDVGRPQLPGSSLMGVLRAKAEWLEALAYLRNNKTNYDPSQNPKVQTTRLFGAQGDQTPSAGRLVATRIEVKSTGTRKELTSVKIDRFTQGTMEGGLFTIAAFINPVFEIQLSLNNRLGDKPEQIEEDTSFVSKLMEELSGDSLYAGLDISHGVNRGFGWFEVQPRKAEGPSNAT
jgi:CRISPR/Cas system CSM-associated protein Csm3 (group 7 of RAMP superfamily)